MIWLRTRRELQWKPLQEASGQPRRSDGCRSPDKRERVSGKPQSFVAVKNSHCASFDHLVSLNEHRRWYLQAQPLRRLERLCSYARPRRPALPRHRHAATGPSTACVRLPSSSSLGPRKARERRPGRLRGRARRTRRHLFPLGGAVRFGRRGFPRAHVQHRGTVDRLG